MPSEENTRSGEAFQGAKTIWEMLREWNEKRLAGNRAGQEPSWSEQAAQLRNPPMQEMPPPTRMQPSPLQAPPMQEMAPPTPMQRTPQVPPSQMAGGDKGMGGSSPYVESTGPETSRAGSELPEGIWEQLGPEGIAQLMKMGGLQEQLGHAQSLREAESPTGRYVSNGRVYTSGSALEHIVSGYGKYKGGKDVKRIQGEQEAGRMSIVDLLRNKMGGGPPPAALGSGPTGPPGIR